VLVDTVRILIILQLEAIRRSRITTKVAVSTGSRSEESVGK
jgi:hypothetical protein